MSFDLSQIGVAGIALVMASLSIWIYASLSRPEGALAKLCRAYGRSLDKDLRLLLSTQPAIQVMRAQAFGFAVLLAFSALLESTFFFALAAGAVVLPPLLLRLHAKQRVKDVEGQLPAWLLMLANMLRTTSSLADAIAGTASLASKPMSEEVDLLLKEVKCGASLDQALRGMADRLGSRTVSITVTALLVGRKTGGDLPKLLEDTSESLRELRRLEGVLATKTSEARAQFVVLGLAPPVLYLAFNKMSPEFFDPLYEGPIGYMILGASIGLWIFSLLIARGILRVNL